MGPYRRRTATRVCTAVTTGLLLTSCTLHLPRLPDASATAPAPPRPRPTASASPSRAAAPSMAAASAAPPSPTATPPPGGPRAPHQGAARPGLSSALGAFVGSEADGVRDIAGLQDWLGGTDLRVGHTYLPGDVWANIEGRPDFLRPWADWKRARADRLFVLNVPMAEHNEGAVPDDEVRDLLRQGAQGRFDRHFATLARHLVAAGVPDAVLVLGWEMNGTTYTHRCGPDPQAWKAYWRRAVTAMRAVPGQRFRFDFAPSRGRDAVGWTRCYPGDDVVDIVGMDTYDQPAGESFDQMVHEPFGLQEQVDFAARHGKPVSYPEWGLFRNGDNPGYVNRMLDWMDRHPPVYQSITDYCPHGVWSCADNPESARAYRRALFGRPEQVHGAPTPSPAEPSAVGLPPAPGRGGAPRPARSAAAPGHSPKAAAHAAAHGRTTRRRFCVDLGGWLRHLLGHHLFCLRWDVPARRGDAG